MSLPSSVVLEKMGLCLRLLWWRMWQLPVEKPNPLEGKYEPLHPGNKTLLNPFPTLTVSWTPNDQLQRWLEIMLVMSWKMQSHQYQLQNFSSIPRTRVTLSNIYTHPKRFLWRKRWLQEQEFRTMLADSGFNSLTCGERDSNFGRRDVHAS